MRQQTHNVGSPLRNLSWSSHKFHLAYPDQGNAILEFALVMPLMVLIITIICQLGIVFNQQISLTHAATIGAQMLMQDRLSTSEDPCADTFRSVTAAAPTLKASNIVMTLTMNNNAPISLTSCPGKQTQLVQGGPVTVQVTYPYSITLIGYQVSSLSGTMTSGAITETEY
jgi:Flp pilus assembly protein TadG